MFIRPIETKDVEGFYQMMCLLDEETEYMMYEPGERREKSPNLSRLAATVENAVSGGDLLLVAENEEKEIVGYLWAERGKLNRVRHTAYIVVGIRKTWQHRGLGTEFFRRLDLWAKDQGIIRLELTVECDNIAAKALYEKSGFRVEGIRPQSMKVNGRLVDEYYMGKILES